MIHRNTRQKQIILETALRLDHPTATEVYEAVLQKDPGIGRATVFRVLKGYAAEGKLRSVYVPDSGEIFDKTLSPHYHVRCRLCGRVGDVPLQYMDELAARVEAETGMEILSHELSFLGICRDCKAREQTEAKQ